MDGVFEVNLDYFGFTLVRSLIGSENSHLDQSDAAKTNHDLFPRILLGSRGLYLYNQIFCVSVEHLYRLAAMIS